MVDILSINFEPLTFCCVLFVSSILVYDAIRYGSAYLVHISVNVIDINMCKVLIIIDVKCVTFVSETFTRYGSNITNVWHKIFTPVTLAFSHEVVHEKIMKIC